MERCRTMRFSKIDSIDALLQNSLKSAEEQLLGNNELPEERSFNISIQYRIFSIKEASIQKDVFKVYGVIDKLKEAINEKLIKLFDDNEITGWKVSKIDVDELL